MANGVSFALLEVSLSDQRRTKMSHVTLHRVDEQGHRSLPILGEIAKRFEDVQRRAYELFEKRRCEAGHALEDWLKAEHELFGWPVAEMSEHEDGYELQVRLPGLDAKHIQVTVAPQEIIVHGAAEPEKPAGNATVLWSEFETPSLCRRFELPGPIDTARVSTKLEKGVLTLLIPKGRPAKQQKITTVAA
jgi:HSP20 family molecular chaperone IbpA